MAAGLGFKDFVTGEVLTAADVDGYLMQGIWVFASATARDAAVTSPQEGNFAYLKDTNTTTYYTGSAWTNLDTTGMVNPMTTTGDTIYSSSGSTPARLGIGSTGQVLTVAGGVPSWATPAAGGFVGASVYKTANQSIANNTAAALTFTNENFDTNSIHDNSTNTSRFTIPSGKDGKWLFTAIVTWDANSTGQREIRIRKNNTASTEVYNIMQTISSGSPSQGISFIADAVATDYFELYCKQNSGGALNVLGDATFTNYTIFQCVYLGA